MHSWNRASGQGQNTYNVVSSHFVGLPPGAHDIGIVVSENSDDIDALLPQLGQVLNVARDMASRADGGESTWKAGVDVSLVSGMRGIYRSR
jgi:hypothetical protein